jgi:alpha-L-fucosidase
MKKIFLAILLLFSLSLWSQNQIQNLNAIQFDQIERGYGMFIHFGLNTFNEIEWSDGKLPASSYNPTKLDCNQWVKTAKEAGFRYVILITKHHDGFCLWDSKYTNYDVASSPVKTDVVAEVAKACKKYGIKLGLYYSLWDRHEISYKNELAYKDYMKNQLAELMTNYGEICELWFDGGWDKKESAWHLQEIYDSVKAKQPNCLITVNHTIGYPKGGSKKSVIDPKDFAAGDPIRYFPVDFRIKDPNFARWDDPKLYNHEGKMYELAFEHTICLSDRWNWFQKKNDIPARPLDELEELVYWGTANNNLMIINIPPDLSGKIRKHERKRIFELANRLGIKGGKKPLPSGPLNLTFGQNIKATTESEKHLASNAIDCSLETHWAATDSKAELEITFDKKIAFDRISIFENAVLKDLGDNFSKIRTFKIKEFELQIFTNGNWDVLYAGNQIGSCKIINLPKKITTEKIRLKILQADGNPSIDHFAVSDSATRGYRIVKK